MESGKQKYKSGDKLKLLFAGTDVEVVKYYPDTSSHETYIVTTEGGTTMCCDIDDMAPERSEIYQRVQHYKKRMIEKGFKCLAMGRDGDGNWRAFYFKEHEQYNPTVRQNKGITFKYYWGLP